MSIRAIRWVWPHTLPTTHKLVLLVLADMADDAGYCWPSVQTVAKHCGVSTRTVRRIIRDLEDGRLLTSESRQRDDGSRTSNLYLLGCAGVSLSSEGADAHVRRGGHTYPEGPDVDVRSRSVIGSSIDQQQRSVDAPAGVVDATQVGLRFPSALTPNQRQTALNELSTLSRAMAQALLDELGWRIDAGSIRTSPLAYLQGMVRHAKAGSFEATAPTPRPGNRQVAQREHSYGSQADTERPRPQSPYYGDVESNPLCQRAIDMQRRALHEKETAAVENSMSGRDHHSVAPTSEPPAQYSSTAPKPFAYLRAVIGD